MPTSSRSIATVLNKERYVHASFIKLGALVDMCIFSFAPGIENMMYDHIQYLFHITECNINYLCNIPSTALKGYGNCERIAMQFAIVSEGNAIILLYTPSVFHMCLGSIATQSADMGGLALMRHASDQYQRTFSQAPPKLIDERPECVKFFLEWLIPRQDVLRKCVAQD